MQHLFGEILVSKGILSPEQLAEGLRIQREDKPYLRLGEILLGLEFLTIQQLDHELGILHSDIRIGQILIHEGITSGLELEEALRIQERSGKMLGEILITLGYCSQGQLDRALSKQSHLARFYESVKQIFGYGR
ncbi:MAG TPA: hypothetical protein DD435_15270 [Cyanobacteria bacterium UBA8530]|nr:hypothetical protein [Cyanobacteria bacterium UBA8530]